jgi:group II intron reverse transcriptase/maturase
MQSAETVLDVLRERGRRGPPCTELYRQLFNPGLYLMAYGRLYSNQGAMTPGVDGETADGMTTGRIGRIIDAMRHERYRFTPARRVYIPKKDGKKLRPLGLPSWTGKLVGDVVRLLLEAYYEPRFSARSHGFRPGRGCHTALTEVATYWTGTTWFIEGDLADCFGSFDHEIMLSILGEHIHDNRFLRLVRNMLKAGYLQDWEYNATLSGVPQGGIASPVLSNIYLDRLDRFVETQLIPQHTRGEGRTHNRAYGRVKDAIGRARRRDDLEEVRRLRKHQRTLPRGNPRDPGYRRLWYTRYADDHLLGFIGPRDEAEQIKARLAQFLREDLKLELSPDKTLITHGRTGAARFLGYEITVQHADHKTTNGRRSVNGKIALRVPRDVITSKSAPFIQRGKPERRPDLLNFPDIQIISRYGAQWRGYLQYYLLAHNVWRLNRLQWVMLTSMLKTLAGKHRSTVSKMADKYQATIDTPAGPRVCFQTSVEREGRKPLVARFGGIPLKRRRKAVLDDSQPAPLLGRRHGSELLNRLRRGRCEWCEQRSQVQVHQVSRLADLTSGGRSQPAWAQLMARMRRKTLIVCPPCHDRIHNRQPAHTLT